jgi:hypothetical protein
MAMSEQVPQPWEVWHARFDFSEGHGYKFRPVIVLAARADGSLVAMVTSAGNKLSLEHDYPIREWKAAGLDKPSIARLDRIAEIPPGYLGTAGRIGRLAESDISAIRVILSKMTG